MSASPGSGARDGAPFVVGVARSGTTLLRLMLDAHPAVAIPPETGFVSVLARRPWLWPPAIGRRRFVRYLAGTPQWRDFRVDASELAAALAGLERFTLAEGLRTFYRLYAARFGKPRWGDKTPGYGPYARAIARVLPEARFVHIIRDGRDVALSLQPLWFSPARDVAGLARHWVQAIEQTRRSASATPHLLEVRYEDLVGQPEPVLRRVCAFLDLGFDPAMLAFHERAPARLEEHEARVGRAGRIVATRAQRLGQQWRTTQPADTSRVGRWRTDMKSEDVRAFEQVAGPMLASLGYQVGR